MTWPNESEPASSTALGVPPSPPSGTCTVALGEFCVATVSNPLTVPDAGGTKATASVHDSFTRRSCAQVELSSAKAVDPVTCFAPSSSQPDPVFVSVTVFVTLTPALRTPKSRDDGASSP